MANIDDKDKKISELEPNYGCYGNELIPVADNGENKSITPTDIQEMISSRLCIYNKYGATILCDKDNSATGNYSLAQGSRTVASGQASHAEGRHTESSGAGSHAEGIEAFAKGSYSHAEGNYTYANAPNSHSEGHGTIAENYSEHAAGIYNESKGNTPSEADAVGNPDSTIHTVGNGNSKNRHNAHEIRYDGTHYIPDVYAEGEYYEKPMINLQGKLKEIDDLVNDKADKIVNEQRIIRSIRTNVGGGGKDITPSDAGDYVYMYFRDGLNTASEDNNIIEVSVDTNKVATKGSVDKLVNDLDVVETLAESINKGLGETIQRVDTIESDYARQEGNYPNLISGAAYNLEGLVDKINDSAYRPVGDEVDVKNGAASIESVKGNAVAWNQLLKNGNFANGLTNWSLQNNSQASVANNIVTVEPKEEDYSYIQITYHHTPIQGHKYLAKVDCKCNPGTNAVNFLMSGLSKLYIPKTSDWETALITLECGADTSKTINLALINTSNTIQAQFKNANVFDLTLIYGAGNEPTDSNEFLKDYQRWFGKPLAYEDFDEGSIRSVNATGIKTVGFNLSHFNEFEGDVADLKNYEVFVNNMNYEGQLYCQVEWTQENTNIRPRLIVEYTEGNIQTLCMLDDKALSGSFSAVTVTNRGKVKRIYITSNTAVGHVTAKNLCINFSWSGKRNGEYEPYWDETKALPLTSLRGRLNGEGEAVTVFADGMKRAGSVYDEIRVENGIVKAIKRVGSVDLGSVAMNMQQVSEHNRFTIDVPNINKEVTQFNGLCAKYKTIFGTNWVGEYGLQYNRGRGDGFRLWIYDDNFTDINSFKEAMREVLLYYELAEPEVYVVDDFELPMVYRVDDWGTEEIIKPENSIAPALVTRYGLNAVDTIRRLPDVYLSKKEATPYVRELEQLADWKSNLGYAADFVAISLNDASYNSTADTVSLDTKAIEISSGEIIRYGENIPIFTIPGATNNSAGIMTAEDKRKLNELDNDLNNAKETLAGQIIALKARIEQLESKLGS